MVSVVRLRGGICGGSTKVCGAMIVLKNVAPVKEQMVDNGVRRILRGLTIKMCPAVSDCEIQVVSLRPHTLAFCQQ